MPAPKHQQAHPPFLHKATTYPHARTQIIKRIPAGRARGRQLGHETIKAIRFPRAPIRPIIPLELAHVLIAQANPPRALIQYLSKIIVFFPRFHHRQGSAVLPTLSLRLGKTHHFTKNPREARPLEFRIMLRARALQPDAGSSTHDDAGA